MSLFLLISTACCLIAVLFAPLRFAYLGVLVAGHLNLTSEYSNQSFDIFNSARIVLLPTILFLRLKFSRKKSNRIDAWKCVKKTTPWIVFFVFSCISVLWLNTPGYAPYLKQIGYFGMYIVLFAVIYHGWIKGIINEKTIIYYICISTVIAIFQTYVFGNQFGSTLNWSRFVSFTAKQQFGEHLLAVGILILTIPKLSFPTRVFIALVILIEILLNGSRTGLAAFIVGAMIIATYNLYRHSAKYFVKYSMLLITAVIAIVVAIPFQQDNLRQAIDSSRLKEIENVITGDKGLDEFGSLRDRFELWSTVDKRISNFNHFEQVFGRGLSSGWELVDDLGFHQASVSANRVFHNEFLRVRYELGYMGLALFTSVILMITLTSIRLLSRYKDPTLLAFLPGLFSFLFVENILSASGNAGGIGMVLILAYAVSRMPHRIKTYQNLRATMTG